MTRRLYVVYGFGLEAHVMCFHCAKRACYDPRQRVYGQNLRCEGCGAAPEGD